MTITKEIKEKKKAPSLEERKKQEALLEQTREQKRLEEQQAEIAAWLLELRENEASHHG